MPIIDQPEIIIPKTSGLLSSQELGQYLSVGRNEIPGIAQRFSLMRLEGHFPERDVWRKILGVEPEDDDAVALLRTQLQDINWVAARIGRAASSVRRRVQNGTFDYPYGVQLGDVSKDGPKPRLRRWLPAVIIATKLGDEIAGLRAVEARETDPSAAADEGGNSDANTHEAQSKPTQNNVFSRIAQDNDQSAGHRAE